MYLLRKITSLPPPVNCYIFHGYPSQLMAHVVFQLWTVLSIVLPWCWIVVLPSLYHVSTKTLESDAIFGSTRVSRMCHLQDGIGSQTDEEHSSPVKGLHGDSGFHISLNQFLGIQMLFYHTLVNKIISLVNFPLINKSQTALV